MNLLSLEIIDQLSNFLNVNDYINFIMTNKFLYSSKDISFIARKLVKYRDNGRSDELERFMYDDRGYSYVFDMCDKIINFYPIMRIKDTEIIQRHYTERNGRGLTGKLRKSDNRFKTKLSSMMRECIKGRERVIFMHNFSPL